MAPRRLEGLGIHPWVNTMRCLQTHRAATKSGHPQSPRVHVEPLEKIGHGHQTGLHAGNSFAVIWKIDSHRCIPSLGEFARDQHQKSSIRHDSMPKNDDWNRAVHVFGYGRSEMKALDGGGFCPPAGDRVKDLSEERSLNNGVNVVCSWPVYSRRWIECSGEQITRASSCHRW